MLENCDGIYLSTDHITATIPSLKITASGEYWYMKFMIFEREFEGKSHFDTEQECLKEIGRLFGKQEVFVSNEESIEDAKAAEEVDNFLDNLQERITFVENRVAELQYDKEWEGVEDPWDIKGL